TNTHLRWLLYQRYALQGVEQAAARGPRRRFRVQAGLGLSESACFVLTEPGAAYARHRARMGPGEVASRGANEPRERVKAGSPRQVPPAGGTPADLEAFVIAYRELREARRSARGHQRGARGNAVPLCYLRELGVGNDALLCMMFRAHVE